MVTADRPLAPALAPFANSPLTDFTREENIQAQEAALRQVEAELGATFPLIIAGEQREKAETFAVDQSRAPRSGGRALRQSDGPRTRRTRSGGLEALPDVAVHARRRARRLSLRGGANCCASAASTSTR